MNSNGTAATLYYHTDHLGSVQVTTNQAGAPVERFSYDVFGKRRNVNGTDDAGKITTGTQLKGQFPRRGYTGHEMLDNFSLVHMNGRVYDPGLGRVLSADPIIQAPLMTQSHNRYTYVMNNPLALTDPSGYSWWTSFRDKWLKPIAAIAVSIYAPQISMYLWSTANAVVAGMTAGFIAGGIQGGDLKSAFMGGISRAAFGWLHGMDAGLGKVMAHGMAGGVMSMAQGGDFGSGFLSAGFTQAASMGGLFGNPGEGLQVRAQNAIMAAMVGGTAAVLGGGKFANGAVTGAMSRLLNELAAARRGTWDALTDRRINSLDSRLQPIATDFINTVESETGIQLRITAGYRSAAEQDALYAIGRTEQGSIVTNARGGESEHNFGLAFDVVQMQNGVPNWTMSTNSWNSIGEIGVRLGLQWGGRWQGFVDRPHFQWGSQ